MRTMRMLALASVLGFAPVLGAQPGMGPMGGPPTGGPMGGPSGGPPAGAAFLLAHTGELRLSDQQVTRLAALARREAEQRTAMQAQLRAWADSQRTRAGAPNAPNAPGAPGAGQRPAGPPMPGAELRQRMERAREQRHADLRDALAVLTPDQQATAFELVARRGPDGPRGMRAMRAMRGPGGPGWGPGGGRVMRRGPDGGGRPGAPPPRPPEE